MSHPQYWLRVKVGLLDSSRPTSGISQTAALTISSSVSAYDDLPLPAYIVLSSTDEPGWPQRILWWRAQTDLPVPSRARLQPDWTGADIVACDPVLWRSPQHSGTPFSMRPRVVHFATDSLSSSSIVRSSPTRSTPPHASATGVGGRPAGILLHFDTYVRGSNLTEVSGSRTLSPTSSSQAAVTVRLSLARPIKCAQCSKMIGASVVVGAYSAFFCSDCLRARPRFKPEKRHFEIVIPPRTAPSIDSVSAPLDVSSYLIVHLYYRSLSDRITWASDSEQQSGPPIWHDQNGPPLVNELTVPGPTSTSDQEFEPESSPHRASLPEPSPVLPLHELRISLPHSRRHVLTFLRRFIEGLLDI